MRKLTVFNHVSLDGYFVDDKGDFSWFKNGNDDPEYAAFIAENASRGGELVFGRITYDLMARFWPTPIAEQHSPSVAKGMNSCAKVVFSKTLDQVSWNNTRLVKGDLVTEIRKMKGEAGPGMTILGSGTIVSQLAKENLLDEYQMIVNPVVLGHGRTMFDGVPPNLNLKLANSRTFHNGKVFLRYTAAASSTTA